MKLTIIIVLTYFTMPAFAENTCLKWFQNSKVSPTSKECILNCNTIIKDMSTFDCASRCDDFCKANKCKIDGFWEKILNTSTAFNAFSDDEFNSIATALSRLPKDWRPQALKGFVNANKPIDLTAILTPASNTDDQIFLFKRSFSLSNDELTRVIAHEVTHLLMGKEWSNILLQYKHDFGWKVDKHRPGNFVEIDGKMSAEEDLANNLEYYIFDPSTLKAKSPTIHKWLGKKLQHSLKLQKGCKYEN